MAVPAHLETSVSARPFCVLSLDGGAARGISTDTFDTRASAWGFACAPARLCRLASNPRKAFQRGGETASRWHDPTPNV